MAGVVLQVGDELMFGRVFREMIREIEEWELAELAGKMELETIVAALLPQRCDAVPALQEENADAALVEARGGGEADGPAPTIITCSCSINKRIWFSLLLQRIRDRGSVSFTSRR